LLVPRLLLVLPRFVEPPPLARPVLLRAELEREDVEREAVERFAVEGLAAARDEVERVVELDFVAFASCFCAWSKSRWSAFASLLLSRRASETNFRRSV
jgi:hypothetical protein